MICLLGALTVQRGCPFYLGLAFIAGMCHYLSLAKEKAMRQPNKKLQKQTKAWYKQPRGIALIALSIVTFTFPILLFVLMWKSKQFPKWAKIAITVFVGIVVVGGISSEDSGNQTSHNNQPAQIVEQQKAAEDARAKAELAAQAAAQKRQAIIDQYASAYCQSHTDLKINEPTLNEQGWPHTNGVRGGMTSEECVTIIGKLYDQGTQPQYLKSMSEDKVAIGMSKLEVLYTWSSPNDVNTTLVAGNKSEQWVYGSPIYGGNYVYFDNGIVTSIQGH